FLLTHPLVVVDERVAVMGALERDLLRNRRSARRGSDVRRIGNSHGHSLVTHARWPSPRVRGSRAASVCGHAAEATTRKTGTRLGAVTSNAPRTRSRAPNLHTPEPHMPRRRDLKRASHPQPCSGPAAPGRA